MNCTIEINDMRLYARHGVMPQENTVGNIFEVTVHLTYPSDDNSFLTDDLAETLNYAEIADIIRGEMAVPSKLLENVAARIRGALLSRFPTVVSGLVRVAKLTPPIPASMASAAVTLRW